MKTEQSPRSRIFTYEDVKRLTVHWYFEFLARYLIKKLGKYLNFGKATPTVLRTVAH
jgi:hypothetical protein